MNDWQPALTKWVDLTDAEILTCIESQLAILRVCNGTLKADRIDIHLDIINQAKHQLKIRNTQRSA